MRSAYGSEKHQNAGNSTVTDVYTIEERGNKSIDK